MVPLTYVTKEFDNRTVVLIKKKTEQGKTFSNSTVSNQLFFRDVTRETVPRHFSKLREKRSKHDASGVCTEIKVDCM